MKKHIKTLFVAAFALALGACNDTDIDLFESPAQEEGSGTLNVTNTTVSVLEFAWEPVQGVNQYGYKLIDADGRAVRQGLTRETSLVFEKLEPDSKYDLTVEAYGGNGVPTKVYRLSANTNPIRRLATPDINSLHVEFNDGRITITWAAVTGAETYDYVLYNSAGVDLLEGTITVPEITVNSLPVGDYTLEVTADAEVEDYTRSETAVFAFTREPQPVATYNGTYKSAVLDASYSCVVTAYDNGTYSIGAFYGVEGYNLGFSISGGAVYITNSYREDGKYKYVNTGLTGENATLRIYEDPSYSTYSVTPSGKRIKLYVFPGDSTEGVYDTFTWK